MKELFQTHIELPVPKNNVEAQAFDYARTLVSHIVANPTFFKNGIEAGRTMGSTSMSHNPIKAVANNKSFQLLSVARHSQYDSPAFNIGLVAGAASETKR